MTYTAVHAHRVVVTERSDVGGFTVGLELVHAAGFGIFDRLREAGAERIFYDAKLHDIPNTVARAVRGIARMGVWMVNVHASGVHWVIDLVTTPIREVILPSMRGASAY